MDRLTLKVVARFAGTLEPDQRQVVQTALDECRSLPMSACTGEDDMEDLLEEGFDGQELNEELLNSIIEQEVALAREPITARVAARATGARR